MAIEIKTVTTKKDLKTFVRFANKMYKGNKFYVPSMPMDDLKTLDKNYNAAFDFCEAEYFLAYKDGKLAGRVAAILNKKANEAWKVNQIRFGWFDFIDDIEVSKALLDSVIAFGKARGVNQIVGPLGFTDFDPEGMLVEGYDRMSTMALIYNHPYYPEHLQKLGYEKETGWVEYRLTLPDEVPERHVRVAEFVTERYGLKVVKKTKSQVNKEKYGQKIFTLLNEAYKNLYGFSLLSEKQIDQFVDTYLGVIDMDMLSFVEDKEGNLIAAGLTMPSIAETLQKCNGEMLPFGWYHLLKALKAKRITDFDLLLIAVRPDYQDKGVTALIFNEMTPHFLRYGIQRVETTAILEDNHKSRANFLAFDHIQHKRRRAYVKAL